MDRKTNLFYNASSQDSNFITFSNYTESLTGNFLSTDTKLFPSTFMCLYIPELDCKDEKYIEEKQKFIDNYLVRRYENKMAFLRDYCKHYENHIQQENAIINSDLAEAELLPLNYLLEYIYEYSPKAEITFIDNITEQDYNGTFADTICIINSTKFKSAYAYFDSSIPEYVAQYDANQAYLYGWYNKSSYLYCLEYDYNRDGHVNDIDVQMFKADEEHIREIIKLENPKFDAAAVDKAYNDKLNEITYIANNNKNLPIQYTGPDYSYMYSYSYNMLGTNECTMGETGECNCNVSYENSTSSYYNESTQTSYTTTIENNTYTFTYNIANTYLSPIFDVPQLPQRENYLTDQQFDNAVEFYENADKYYKVTSQLSYIGMIEESEVCDTESSVKEVKFNIIIPMYDVIDRNYQTNSFKIEETNQINLQNDKAEPCMYIKNVPMGIWFSGYEPVVLKRDRLSKYSPSWSLVIASQFKPFPYSKEMPDELESSAKAEAFNTFAQILTRQNEMMDKMNEMFKMMANLNSRISDVESNLASTGTSYNLDGLHQDIINLEVYMNNQLTDIRNTIAERDLIWVNREG